MTQGSQPIKLMIVDDSAVLRRLISRAFAHDTMVNVCATAADARGALEKLEHCDVDVVLLDAELPGDDSRTALDHVRARAPGALVIVMSVLSLRAADRTMQLLTRGAHDFLPKPHSPRGAPTRESLIADLRSKIRAHVSADTCSEALACEDSEARSRQFRVIAIGSSTGGPSALEQVLRGIDPDVRLPIVVTQHMPPMFTTILARRLDGIAGRRCVEGADGMPVETGTVYIAPGDQHMTVAAPYGQRPWIRLDREDHVKYCRPAVDRLFKSLPPVYRDQVLAVVLTGMGDDGCDGARAIVDAGGVVLAQDRESSVVWGMPGAVARAGLADATYPLAHLGAAISLRSRPKVRS